MNNKITTGLDSESILNIIKSKSYDGILITDKNGTNVFVSDSYERITGYSPEPLRGNDDSMVKKLGFLETSLWEKIHSTKKPTSMILNYKSGKDVLITGFPIFDEENEYIAIMFNMRDMAELDYLKNKLTHKKDTPLPQLDMNEIKPVVLDEEYINYSKIMQDLTAVAIRIANVESTVLITGESGVGKDVYAKLIHKFSNNHEERPFIKVSCGAIPENLLESELFGYEPGAFTGASKDGKVGLFELANGGILFLDEIGEMPMTLQCKLLTVLQDRSFMRVGGKKVINVNVRIIAATNKDLEEAVKQGQFRKDLYYRLNVVPIYIPPLRDRPEDILPLVMMMVDKYNKKYELNKAMDISVYQAFEKYPWPGNIRELSNIVERLLVLCPYDIITESYLPLDLSNPTVSNISDIINQELPLKEFLEKMEHERILRAISKGRPLQDTATELGIDLSTLTRKIQKYNIPKRSNLRYVHKVDSI